MVHIILPDVFTAAFYRLLPGQRETINDLMEKRIVLSYSLDMERKNIWIFIESESETVLMDILSEFPIISYVKLHIHELAYHDAAPASLPDLILN
jgi:hypothetical protein